MKKSKKMNETGLQALIDSGLSYNEAVAIVHVLKQRNKSTYGSKPDIHITIQKKQGGEN